MYTDTRVSRVAGRFFLGSVVTLGISSAVLVPIHDPDQRLWGYLAVGLSYIVIMTIVLIRAIQRDQERTREYYRQYAQFMDDLPQSVLIHSVDTFIYANKAAQRLFQSTGQESIEQLVQEQSWHFFQFTPQRVQPNENVSVRKSAGALVLPDGVSIPVKHTLIIPRSFQNGQVAVSIFEDQRHQHTLDSLIAHHVDHIQQLDRQQTVRLLVGGVAHDLRNTLTRISLLTDTIADDCVDVLGIDGIQSAVANGRALTEQFMVYVCGSSRMHVQEIGSLLQGTAILLRSSVPSNVTLSVHHHSPLYVEIASVEIQQVIVNLVLNAVEALNGQTGEIRLTFTGTIDQVSIAVTDTGPGIHAQDLAHLFDLHVSSKGKTRGLGLASSRAIVERHGGKLTARSEFGHGSCFSIDLPGIL